MLKYVLLLQISMVKLSVSIVKHYLSTAGVAIKR